jgi:hypothetical protein
VGEQIKLLYSPALRMKAGEGEGLHQLDADVADRILPRLIVPPSGERDEAVPLPLHLNRVPDIAPLLVGVWRRRPALIDVTYIMDEFGRDRADDWLPTMFARARSQEVRAIPVASLTDIREAAGGFRASISAEEPIKFGIRVRSDEMVGPELPATMAHALRNLGLTAAQCVVVADFGESDFSNPSIVAPIIGFSLETLQEIGLWKHIIFQGSNYPDRNPAPDGGVVLWPRNEWRCWRLAVKFEASTAQHMIFGDYAADCSKIEFGEGAGKPISHVRYTAGENWRVQRGEKQGTSRDSMHEVYTSIVCSPDFAGASFSYADRFIARAAASISQPHGNPTTWRQLNTTHHITQVVNDIATVRGLAIRRITAGESVQFSLLPQP